MNYCKVDVSQLFVHLAALNVKCSVNCSGEVKQTEMLFYSFGNKFNSSAVKLETVRIFKQTNLCYQTQNIY